MNQPFLSQERPPRFLLNPCGSAGDLHPYLAIGRRLQSMGHEVIVLTNPCYQRKVEEQQLEFVPVGETLNWNAISQDPKIHVPRTAWKEAMGWAVLGTMRETYAEIERLSRDRETIVAAPVWSVGARIAREKLHLRLASVVLNPMLLRSTLNAPLTPQLYMPAWMPRWMKRWQYFVGDMLFVDPLIGPSIRSFRRELNLPPTTRRWMNRWWFSPDLVLGMFLEEYVPPQPDWPASVQLVGPTAWDPDGDPHTFNQVQEFLTDGAPPLCFVPGSVGADHSFFEIVSETCLKLQQRLLMLHGSFDAIQVRNKDREMRAPYAPLAQTLPFCKALIHCGCAGTAAHAMRIGIPHLVWPRVNDQFDIADRLKRMGVAEVIPRRQFTQRRLMSSLQRLLEDPHLHEACQRLKRIMLRHDGTQLACEALLNLTHHAISSESHAV